MIHRKKLLGVALLAAGAGLLFALALHSCAVQVLLGLALVAAGLAMSVKC